jgi:hypothetical protein
MNQTKLTLAIFKAEPGSLKEMPVMRAVTFLYFSAGILTSNSSRNCTVVFLVRWAAEFRPHTKLVVSPCLFIKARIETQPSGGSGLLKGSQDRRSDEESSAFHDRSSQSEL